MNKTTKLQMGTIVAALTLAAGLGVVAAASPPAPTPPGSTLEQRVTQRKAERGTSLNPIDTQRTISTCVNAQGKLRLIQNEDVAMLDNRSKVYGIIDAKLWISTGQLKLSKQDTFPLEKQRLAFVDKTANFQALANNYKQALDDTLVINCKADPNGFRAMLETVGLYFDLLRTQSTDNHDYVIDTVKISLQDYSVGLQPKAATPEGDGN